MNTITEAEIIQFAEGRKLSYGIVGTEGPWCIHHHGTGSSRLEGEMWQANAEELGFRILTIDRPSYGSSTPKDDRTFLEWPADVTRVADHLGIETFGVSGYSGGGPHALALAFAMPDRVTHAVVINSGASTEDEEVLAQVANQDRRTWELARNHPKLFRSTVSRVMSRPPGRLTVMLGKKLLPPEDLALLEDPVLYAQMERNGVEARRQPGRRFDEALLIWGRDWGFDPYAVDVPLSVWTGKVDQFHAFAVKLAKVASDATLHEFPGGHAGFMTPELMEQIARAMKGETR